MVVLRQHPRVKKTLSNNQEVFQEVQDSFKYNGASSLVWL